MARMVAVVAVVASACAVTVIRAAADIAHRNGRRILRGGDAALVVGQQGHAGIRHGERLIAQCAEGQHHEAGLRDRIGRGAIAGDHHLAAQVAPEA